MRTWEESGDATNHLHDQARTAVLKLNRQIRSLLPDVRERIKVDRVAISEVKEGFLDGEAIQRVIIILRGKGCEWALSEDGGCSMCGHLCGTTRGSEISSESFIEQFEEEVSRYDFSRFPMLCIYNSGSFLNENELPSAARQHIFTRVAKIPGIKRLIIESRPQYITDEAVDEIERLLPNTITEIGVGLESSDHVRALCLNKGFSSEDFRSVGKKLSTRQVKLLAYVLLKPPFLTEKEGIDEACETIEYAFNVGSSIVSLEPVSVQDFTLVAFLYEAACFRPPWIWSVIEVIRRTHQLGLVRLGGFEFFPIPRIFTHNCTTCDDIMVKSIQRFNRSYDIGVFKDLICNCRKEWEYDCRDIAEPLPSRILRVLGGINSEEVFQRMQMNFDKRGVSESLLTRLLFYSCNVSDLRRS